MTSPILIQKGDLASSSFSNDNSNNAGGVKVRVDTGSDVKTAIDAAIEAAASDGSETKITEGTNVTVTGTGTDADPYVINSTGGGGGTVPDASATEAGIVNLVDGQILGSGAKVIGGVLITDSTSYPTGVPSLDGPVIAIRRATGGLGPVIAISSTYTTVPSGAYDGIAIGEAATLSGDAGTSIGHLADAGSQAVALGNNAQATGDGNVSIGTESLSSSYESTAIGRNSQATGPESTAIGRNSQATEPGSTAIGNFARSIHNYSTAIGSYAVTTKEYQTVLGNADPASSSKNTEYLMSGSLSFDGSDNGGIIGQVLTSNGNDVSPSWADNIPPVASLTQAGVVDLTNGQVLGNGAKVIDGIRISKTSRGDPANPESAPTTFPPTNISITNDPTTPGQYVGAVGDNSVVIGINANGDFNTVVIGSDSKGIDGAVVLGHQALATNGASVVLGKEAVSYAGVGGSSNQSVVIGNVAKLGRIDGGGTGKSSVVIGPAATAAINSSVDGNGSTVVGAGAQAGNTSFGSSGENSTALGYQSNAKGFNSTALGANSETTKDNQVVLGNTAIAETVIRGAIAVGGATVDAGLVGQVLTSAGPDAPAQWSDNIPPVASATQAGVVNLTSGTEPPQVLGTGPKIIDGVTIKGYDGTGNLDSVILGNALTISETTGYDAVVIGNNAKLTGGGGVTIGNGSSAGNVCIAIGLGAEAQPSSGGSIAIGFGRPNMPTNTGTTANGDGSIAISGKANGDGSIAIGGNASHVNSVAIGIGATTTKDNQIILGGPVAPVTVVIPPMVETPGRFAARGYVGVADSSLATGYLDLSTADYFIKPAGVLATEPINFPMYALAPSGAPSVVSIVIQSDNTLSTFTSFWPGIAWENSTPPTHSAGTDLYGFIGLNNGTTTTWRGVVLAQNIG